MADAIIFRRRGSGGGGAEQNAEMVGGTQSNTGNWWTAIFTSNGWFKAGTAKDNQYSVLIFGGGGGGANMYRLLGWGTGYGNWVWSNGTAVGGGGGAMNKLNVTLAPNTNVTVTIGRGSTGQHNASIGAAHTNYTIGGTSSFGTYGSASGGVSGHAAWVLCDSNGSVTQANASLARLATYMSCGGSGGGVYAPYGNGFGINGSWGSGYPYEAMGCIYQPWRYVNSNYDYFISCLNFGSGGIWIEKMDRTWYHNGQYYNGLSRAATLGGGSYGGSGGIWLNTYDSEFYGYINANDYVHVPWYNQNNGVWNYCGNGGKSTYGGTGSYRSSGTAGSTCSNAGWQYANGTWMSGTSAGGSYGGGGGGYGGRGGSWGGGGGGWCANGGNYGGGGGGYGVNGYGGDNAGGGGAYGRGGGPRGGALYGGGGWGMNNEVGANGVIIVQWYSN